ncbi:MAG: twin-arginine translocase subunit TatC [Steroidobacter sp.]
MSNESADNAKESMAEGTLISHLLELRDRLIRAVVFVAIVFAPCAYYSNRLFTMIAQPLLDKLPKGTSMVSTSLIAPFMTPIKLAFLVALFISMPFVLYQVWAFVAPGLYKHEKRFAMPLLISSVILFYCGAAFAFYLVFPVMFSFFAATTPQGVLLMPDMTQFLDFVSLLIFSFGAAFEIPVATVLLVATGLVKMSVLKKNRGYVVIVISVVAAALTPPDAVSMMLMAAPMYLLYELGIIFCRILLKDKLAAQANEEAEEASS